MNNQKLSTNDIAKKVKEEYKAFFQEFEQLKQEQKQLIKEYRGKLEQKKLLRLREQLDIKE